MASTVDGDLIVRGNVTMESIGLPAECVGTDNLDPNQPIACDKQNHQYVKEYRQAKTSTVVAGREEVHVAFAPGRVQAFRVCLIDTVNLSGATITVKLYKNGADVTSVAAVITDANTLYQMVAGTLTSNDYNADDVWEAVVTVAAGGGTVGKGLVLQVVFREAAG